MPNTQSSSGTPMKVSKRPLIGREVGRLTERRPNLSRTSPEAKRTPTTACGKSVFPRKPNGRRPVAVVCAAARAESQHRIPLRPECQVGNGLDQTLIGLAAGEAMSRGAIRTIFVSLGCPTLRSLRRVALRFRNPAIGVRSTDGSLLGLFQ